VLASEKSLSDSNADVGALGWALSPATRNSWKQKSRVVATNYPSFIMEGGLVNDYRCAITNNLSDGDLSVFGNWSEMWILFWADGMEMTVDKFTRAAQGEIVLTAHAWIDFLIPHIRSFCVSADSAAQ
jgi:hypothetical protein